MATVAELWIKYHLAMEAPKPTLPPVEQSTADVFVIPYHKWIRNKCKCCGRGGASGLWECEFTTFQAMYLLCAACGMREAFAKWNGFFSPKLVRVDLRYTLTYPNRSTTDEQTQATQD